MAATRSAYRYFCRDPNPRVWVPTVQQYRMELDAKLRFTPPLRCFALPRIASFDRQSTWTATNRFDKAFRLPMRSMAPGTIESCRTFPTELSTSVYERVECQEKECL